MLTSKIENWTRALFVLRFTVYFCEQYKCNLIRSCKYKIMMIEWGWCANYIKQQNRFCIVSMIGGDQWKSHRACINLWLSTGIRQVKPKQIVCVFVFACQCNEIASVFPFCPQLVFVIGLGFIGQVQSFSVSNENDAQKLEMIFVRARQRSSGYDQFAIPFRREPLTITKEN